MNYCVIKKEHLLFILFFCCLIACQQTRTKSTNAFNTYYDATPTNSSEYLIAVFKDSVPELGSPVAFINSNKDTIIPFGKYIICWTDTLKTYAIVFGKIHTKGRTVAIDRNERILFDVVLFDNWPDELHDGLFRVKRNGKTGFANSKGEIIIPCQFAYAFWFENGRAKVTYKCKEYISNTDPEHHISPISNEWFYIDTLGNKIK